MMNQISLQVANGKVVKDFAFVSRYLIITFTDNTFIQLAAISNYGGSEIEEHHFGWNDFDMNETIRLGIMEASELERLHVDQVAKHAAEREEELRKQYLILKKKFGE